MNLTTGIFLKGLILATSSVAGEQPHPTTATTESLPSVALKKFSRAAVPSHYNTV